jgi:tRNA(fMet)-specific endonuclease VapC
MLDTNICIYIAKYRPPEVKARFKRTSPGQLVMSVITYGELCCGASRSVQRAKAFNNLEKMVLSIPVEPLAPAVGSVYGEVRGKLAAEGRLIGGNDLWIAAHALTLGLILVTNNDREFKRIAGLSVENWTK